MEAGPARLGQCVRERTTNWCRSGVGDDELRKRSCRDGPAVAQPSWEAALTLITTTTEAHTTLDAPAGTMTTGGARRSSIAQRGEEQPQRRGSGRARRGAQAGRRPRRCGSQACPSRPGAGEDSDRDPVDCNDHEKTVADREGRHGRAERIGAEPPRVEGGGAGAEFDDGESEDDRSATQEEGPEPGPVGRGRARGVDRWPGGARASAPRWGLDEVAPSTERRPTAPRRRIDQFSELRRPRRACPAERRVRTARDRCPRCRSRPRRHRAGSASITVDPDADGVGLHDHVGRIEHEKLAAGRPASAMIFATLKILSFLGLSRPRASRRRRSSPPAPRLSVRGARLVSRSGAERDGESVSRLFP